MERSAGCLTLHQIVRDMFGLTDMMELVKYDPENRKDDITGEARLDIKNMEDLLSKLLESSEHPPFLMWYEAYSRHHRVKSTWEKLREHLKTCMACSGRPHRRSMMAKLHEIENRRFCPIHTRPMVTCLDERRPKTDYRLRFRSGIDSRTASKISDQICDAMRRAGIKVIWSGGNLKPDLALRITVPRNVPSRIMRQFEPADGSCKIVRKYYRASNFAKMFSERLKSRPAPIPCEGILEEIVREENILRWLEEKAEHPSSTMWHEAYSQFHPSQFWRDHIEKHLKGCQKCSGEKEMMVRQVRDLDEHSGCMFPGCVEHHPVPYKWHEAYAGGDHIQFYEGFIEKHLEVCKACEAEKEKRIRETSNLESCVFCQKKPEQK